MATSKFAALKKVREERNDDLVQSTASAEPLDRKQKVYKDRPKKIEPIPSGEIQLPDGKVRGRPRGKRSNDTYTQITAYIRKETQQRVKLALLQAQDERDFSELVEELLSNWLTSKN